ncbi:MAG: hypothetical protein M5U28_31655 [Sandaracinaceae bacterium]|nr:hypothetical protein [Sandaracinaceae bacterium]
MDEQPLDATIQMPAQASTLAPMVDSLYYDIYWISVAFFVAIVGAMVLFAWRFRRQKGVKSKPPGHHNALELFWTFSPLILLAYMFHEGFVGFMFMSVPPPNSINVRVEAFQWGWRFQQPNGLVESELWVPQGRPVRLIMGSVPRGTEVGQGAVLHSFFVPALRVKRDVVPGMYTSLWFEPTRLGTYDIFCTEYCGVGAPAEGAVLTESDLRVDGRPTAAAGHAGMLSRLHVVPPEEYERHLIEGMRNPLRRRLPALGPGALLAERLQRLPRDHAGRARHGGPEPGERRGLPAGHPGRAAHRGGPRVPARVAPRAAGPHRRGLRRGLHAVVRRARRAQDRRAGGLHRIAQRSGPGRGAGRPAGAPAGPVIFFVSLDALVTR